MIRSSRGALTARPLACALALSSASVASAALPGKTIDVPFDAQRVTQHAEEAHVLRLYLAPPIASPAPVPSPPAPLPLVVYLHGVNTDHRAFRFAGHGGEPDVREITARLMGDGTVPPFVLAAPSTVVFSDFPASLWPAFDLDRLVEITTRTLRGQATLDLDRIIVVGHSGAGCNPRGGVFAAAMDTTLTLRGVMLVDTCLDLPSAPLLVDLPPAIDVVVTFQSKGWARPYEAFGEAFLGPRQARRLASGAVGRDVYEHRTPAARHAHNAMVEEAFQAYLPGLLAPRRSAAPPPLPAIAATGVQS